MTAVLANPHPDQARLEVLRSEVVRRVQRRDTNWLDDRLTPEERATRERQRHRAYRALQEPTHVTNAHAMFDLYSDALRTENVELWQRVKSRAGADLIHPPTYDQLHPRPPAPVRPRRDLS